MSIVVVPDSLFVLAGNGVESRAKVDKKEKLKSWKNLSEIKERDRHDPINGNR